MPDRDALVEECFKLVQGAVLYGTAVSIDYMSWVKNVWSDSHAVAMLVLATAVMFAAFGVVGHRVWLIWKGLRSHVG